MTLVWLALLAVVLVGAPFVGLALARAVREVTATQASLASLARELDSAADGLRGATGAFASSLSAFRTRRMP